jgi:hypothetical protein
MNGAGPIEGVKGVPRSLSESAKWLPSASDGSLEEALVRSRLMYIFSSCI